jgi:hypothetical protein
MPCWKEPFLSFLGREEVSIEEYLDVLPQIFDEKTTRNFRSKNYQSFEFGLDHLNDDEKYIQTEMKKLGKQFDLGKSSE